MAEEGNEEELQISPDEELATKSGWQPLTDWEGDAEDHVSAKEFNFRGELMDRIKAQTSQGRTQDGKIAEMEAALHSLGEHNKKVQEVAYKKAINDLKKQKVEALEVDDHTSVVDIDEQMADLKETKKQADAEPAPTTQEDVLDPLVEKWISDNPWYETNPALQGAADGLARSYLIEHPNAQLVDAIPYVTQEMKKLLPDDVDTTKGKRQNNVTEVNTNTSIKAQSKKYTQKHLNTEQKKIGNTLVAAGAMESLQEYVNQLADIEALEIQG